MLRNGLLACAIAGSIHAQELRIGVFSLFHPTQCEIQADQGRPLQIQSEREHAMFPPGQSVACGVSRVEVRCSTAERVVVGRRILVQPVGGGTLEARVPGRIARRFHGRFELAVQGRELRAVLLLPREEAVAIALQAEARAGMPDAAYAAQAVAIRSYYGANLRRHGTYDVCDTTHCQAFRELAPAGSQAAEAARATEGMRLYFRGEPIEALFSQSCGGETRSLAQAGLPVRNYPYFAVACESCQRSAVTWERRLDPGIAAGLIATPGSEPARLAVVRRLGWSAVPSNHYEVRAAGDHVVVKGRGQGHGVGLCQLGAAAMARAGADFRTILQHYYPQTTCR